MQPHNNKVIRAVARTILTSAFCASAAVSFASNASIIGSSYGNAVHVDLSITSNVGNIVTAVANSTINLAHTSGNAPENYSQSDTIIGASADVSGMLGGPIDVTEFDSIASTAIIESESQSSLTSFVQASFFTSGRGTINDLNLDLFSDLLGISGFLTLSADVLSTVSQIDGYTSSGPMVNLSTLGSSDIVDVEVSLWGNSVTATALENQSLFAGLNIADFGLGIFVNEVEKSCSNTSCSESRNAVRVSFDNFSLNAFYDALFPAGGPLNGPVFNLTNNPIVNGEIILASSFATTSSSTEVSAPSTFAIFIFAVGLLSVRRFNNHRTLCK